MSKNRKNSELLALPTMAPTDASDSTSDEDTLPPDDVRTASTLAPTDAESDTAPAADDLRSWPTVDSVSGQDAEGTENLAPHLQDTLPPDSLPPPEEVSGEATGKAAGKAIGNATAEATADTLRATAERARRSASLASSQPRTATEVSARPGDPMATRGLAPGVVVDRQFELIRELGRGGMGAVFLARDVRLGRLVAVKFVLTRSTSASRRFLAEARTTARCVHQNIVVIHAVDEFNGLPYMVLEYLHGQTLRQLTEQRASDARGLTVARTLELMLPVLRALEQAHSMGIVHRDLKPDNIMLTDTGVVKVLDFGIAKLVSDSAASKSAISDTGVNAERAPDRRLAARLGGQPAPQTRAGTLVGTMPYMAPEQLNSQPVNHQVDIWAAGIILFEMIAGHHPMAPLSMAQYKRVADMAVPMPPAGDTCPAVGELGPIIDRCLLKDPADRVASVSELIGEIEPLVPGHRSVARAEDASPFTGLSAFQERDADRFFGRSEDTLSVVSRIREQPLVAVIGPSGAGKSSLIRAGVIPTLKRSGEGWQAFIARPGRAPLQALAEIIERLERSATTSTRPRPTTGSHTGPSTGPSTGAKAGSPASHSSKSADALPAGLTGDPAETPGRADLLQLMRAEPGYLGAALRTYAQRKLRQVLLFIDQFEETYTLCADADERAVFLACLAGVADDAASPLRVVLSMRADFLERVAENRSFMALATRGLMLLPPMGRAGLRAALEQPLAAVGYRFESQDTVRDMLDGLDGTRGALPLLQFAATMLWKDRDRDRRLLTEDSYRAMGGIAGALAQHADSVVAAMTEDRRKLARAVFERLVTPERTRAVVSVSELRELGGADADAIDAVLDELARARLVVVDTGTVEIVHESLIERWPTLRHWLDENQDDAAFLARLRTAAREWRASGQSEGMLWSGEAAAEAQRWRAGYIGELAGQEHLFLDAVAEHAERAQRRRRRLRYGALAMLGLLALAGAIAFTKAQNEGALRQQKARAKAEDEPDARQGGRECRHPGRRESVAPGRRGR